jgi:hypothetical protein
MATHAARISYRRCICPELREEEEEEATNDDE